MNRFHQALESADVDYLRYLIELPVERWKDQIIIENLLAPNLTTKSLEALILSRYTVPVLDLFSHYVHEEREDLLRVLLYYHKKEYTREQFLVSLATAQNKQKLPANPNDTLPDEPSPEFVEHIHQLINAAYA